MTPRDPPSVDCPQGMLEGIWMGGNVRLFREIPYAEAPVGPLRWRPPVPYGGWNGTHRAQGWARGCPQPPPDPHSIYAETTSVADEDCLRLDIWTSARGEKQPVLVWIHGGGFLTGHKASPLTAGTTLADEGLVVVAINYRLGVLGWLAHPSLSEESGSGRSGNYGLLDQIAALKWVQRNIASFGGDPGNVTIMGESAGGLSVLALMASPLATDLFHRAVAASAYAVSLQHQRAHAHGLPSAEQTGLDLAAAVGANDIAALRGMTPETLIAASAKHGFIPLPIVDGEVLRDQIVDTFDQRWQSKVPLIIGFNAGEIRGMRELLPANPTNCRSYEAAIRTAYGDLAPAFLSLYPANDIDGSMLDALRDGLYGWTAQCLATAHGATGAPAFLYYFDHGYPATDEQGLHAFHACELPYFFGTHLDRHTLPPHWPRPPRTVEEEGLSGSLRSYLAAFARTGAPAAVGQPDWPLNDEHGDYLHIGASVQLRRALHVEALQLNNEIYRRRRRQGQLPWRLNTGIAAAGTIPSQTCGENTD